MFFNSPSDIQAIAQNTSAAVFVMPDNTKLNVKGAIIIQPETKSIITIEQIQSLISRLELRQTTDLFVIIRPADKLGLEAANAFLKNLEEPGDHIHFILITSQPSALLPTILSRTAIYFLREDNPLTASPKVTDKIKDLAKQLMTARPTELPKLAEAISKQKDHKREFALSITGAAIEMLYKSYFITGKAVFLNKLPKFLSLYEALDKNGHIKLQIVANLA